MYTLIDEHLGSKICAYLIGSLKFIRFWKSKNSRPTAIDTQRLA